MTLPTMTDEKINDLRRRIEAGEQVSNDEIIAGLQAIRVARLNAAASAPRARASAAAPTIKLDLAALLTKKNPG